MAVANARDDNTQAVPTLVYRYDAARRRFEELQRLDTLGTTCNATSASLLILRAAMPL